MRAGKITDLPGRADEADEAPEHSVLTRLRAVGLRPTRQRLCLGELLFFQGNQHVTAESLFQDARDAGVGVSLATVYNTLHQFTAAGLLREVIIDASRQYFDTNMEDHHHFYFEDTGEIADIPNHGIEWRAGAVAPAVVPPGMKLSRIDIIVRLRGAG